MKSKTTKALKDVKSNNVSHLQQEFLSCCRHFRTYGSTFFIAEVYMSQVGRVTQLYDDVIITCSIR
ncbi:hypothetical protein ANCCAN_05413 [Ancylostoma caninum]|uniref:Uncharacterized protein n=1 Tax=Ancylostoma caninum TaxID=29170 RepID=A0A368GZX9_ANCCA|nr:hypothetical protein ANCCAN_05413 [Ancylostoma caninum]